MKNYNLTRAEQVILNALDVRDAKVVNGLRIELKMGVHTIKKALISLKDKGLADYTQERKAIYWLAL